MRRTRGRQLGSLGRLRPALILGALLATTGARANGAFPDEFSIHFPASAPQRIYVGANFGLLVSEDDGATWRYSCEPWVTEGSSASLTQNNVDFYQLTASGAMIAQSLEVTRSEDDACTWPVSTGVITGKVVSDLYPDPTDASLVLAVIVDSGGSVIVASHDGGKTYVGPSIYGKNGYLITGVELSRSQPGVVYASSVPFSGAGATFARSSDYGAHWTEFPITVPSGAEPLIMAIDPADPDTVYLRVVAALSDSVWITRNGGQSFDTPLTINGQFSSFLRATDGALYLGTLNGKLYVRAAGATDFTNHASAHFRCLGQRPGASRIFACGDMGIDGFSVGYSDDNGATFQPLMSFVDLLGPLTCAPVSSNCQAHWERIQGVLGIAPPADGGTIPDAGSGGPDGGPPDSGTPPPGGGNTKSGCSATGVDAWSLGVLIAAWLVWEFRRRERNG